MKKDVLMPLLALKWNFGNTTLIWVQTAETFWRWYWRMLWWKVRLRDMPMPVRSSRTNTVSGPKERVLQSQWRCIQRECQWYLRGAWPWYLSRWRVCIRWQRRRRWVWTRWCRKWIICQVWELRTKCRKCCCKKATSSRIWTAFLIRFYEKRVGLIKSKLLLACLLHPA